MTVNSRSWSGVVLAVVRGIYVVIPIPNNPNPTSPPIYRPCNIPWAGVTAAGRGKEEEEEEVKPVVPLSACLARLTREDTLPDYRSPATGVAGPATKHVRFGNFPRYILVQLRRLVFCLHWSGHPIGPQSHDALHISGPIYS